MTRLAAKVNIICVIWICSAITLSVLFVSSGARSDQEELDLMGTFLIGFFAALTSCIVNRKPKNAALLRGFEIVHQAEPMIENSK
jgi:uncharacterized membrane protein YbhN (UPF0104 family)